LTFPFLRVAVLQWSHPAAPEDAVPHPAVDLSRVRTYPLQRRENLVALDDFIFPSAPRPPFDAPGLAEVAQRIIAAREAGKPVIWFMGGHVVKSGLAPVIIHLLERGVITHLASNGAATIHDFEIAMLGHTSEDVAKSIEDGSFGMAEETGAFMNRAIAPGRRWHRHG
jgi:deoxyhypusine synthase